MSPSVDATTFAPFRDLPRELRNAIWEMSLPEDVEELCVFSRHSNWVRANEYPEVMTPFPQIAHVCSESRSEALRHVRILDIEGTYSRAAYRPFRPELDVMVIDPAINYDENGNFNRIQGANFFRDSLTRIGLLATLRHIASAKCLFSYGSLGLYDDEINTLRLRCMLPELAVIMHLDFIDRWFRGGIKDRAYYVRKMVQRRLHLYRYDRHWNDFTKQGTGELGHVTSYGRRPGKPFYSAAWQADPRPPIPQ